MQKYVLTFLILFSSMLTAENLTDAQSLKGYHKLVVFPMISNSDKVMNDKIKKIAEESFAKIGKVNKVSLLAKTPDGEEAIDLDGLVGDGTLTFQINPVLDTEGAILDVVCTSLTLSANVTHNKTKNEGSAIIWTQSYFIKGNLSKNTEDIVSHSLDLLLTEFNESYKKNNSEILTFNLCSS